MRELRLRHLEREEGDRELRLPGDVLGDVADEARLAHRRAGGDHDQVAGLKAAGHVVELAEARRRAGHLRLAAGELLEPLGLVDEDVGDRAEVARLLGAGDVEEQLLGLLDQLLRLALAGVHRLLDPLRGAEQPPQHRVLLDDLRVVAGVAGDGRARRRAPRAPPGPRPPRACPGCAAARRRSARRPARSGRRARGSPRRSSRGGRGRSPRRTSLVSTTTGSIAASETIIAPSTDSSASRLCGCSSGASAAPFDCASIAVSRAVRSRTCVPYMEGPGGGRIRPPSAFPMTNQAQAAARRRSAEAGICGKEGATPPT